jgi:hypothetical protein
VLQDGEPQAIDALASCYDDPSRPPLLSYKHIQAHLSRAAEGQLPVCETLDSSMSGQQQQSAGRSELGSSSTGPAGTNSSSGLVQYSSSGSYEPDAPGPASLLQQQQPQQQLAGLDSWRVLFDGLEAEQPAVTVSNTLLDFGCCSRLSPAEPQSFQVGSTSLAVAAQAASCRHACSCLATTGAGYTGWDKTGQDRAGRSLTVFARAAGVLQVTNCTNAKLVLTLAVPGWTDPLASSSSGSKQKVFTVSVQSKEQCPGSKLLRSHEYANFALQL